MFLLLLTGLLSLPALLFLVATVPVLALLSLPAAFLLVSRKKPASPSNKDDELSSSSKLGHVIVTGGSSGIGLAIAQEAAKQGRKVTILARNQKKLDEAKASIVKVATDKEDASIRAFSVDVSDSKSLAQVAEKIFNDNKTKNEPTFLFCCAGMAHPAKFQDIPVEVIRMQTEINKLGSIFTVQTFLPYITSGTICLCSSAAGQVGVFGYSAYSPTKFALRGFAEVLHMELLNQPIHVQVAYPPDTDTPGFENENKTKPQETKLISETAGLMQPQEIGRRMLYEATKTHPRFAVYFNFDGWILSHLTAGFAPVTCVWDALAQLSATTLFRWIALLYLKDWHRIIVNYSRSMSSSVKKVEDEEIKKD